MSVQWMQAQLHTIYSFSIHILEISPLLSLAWKTGTETGRFKNGSGPAGPGLAQTGTPLCLRTYQLSIRIHVCVVITP